MMTRDKKVTAAALAPAVILIGLTAFSTAINQSITVYLIEQYFCYEHYLSTEPAVIIHDRSGLIDEMLCKIPEIQQHVAQVNGIYQFLTYIPALILMGPWANIVQKFGKKRVLLLNLSSNALSTMFFIGICAYPQFFDIRLIWLKPLFSVIGGGQVIALSLVRTYVAEAVDGKNLSAVLYRCSAVSLGSVFIGLALASYLLRFNVWVLCLLAVSAQACMVPVTICFPSVSQGVSSCLTPEACKARQTQLDQTTLSETTPLAGCQFCDIPRSSSISTVVGAFLSNYRHNLELFKAIFTSSPLTRLTVMAFSLVTMIDGIHIIFTQWVSVTYHWIIADVQALSSFEVTVSGIILLCLPIFTTRYVKHSNVSSSSVDMFVSQAAVAFLFIGLALMSVAPTGLLYTLALVVFVFGMPLADSLRSFSTGLLERPEAVEQLYLGIALMETFGGMAASALWSTFFSMVVGQSWLVQRIPFWVCLVVILSLGLIVQKLKRYSVAMKGDASNDLGSRYEEV